MDCPPSKWTFCELCHIIIKSDSLWFSWKWAFSSWNPDAASLVNFANLRRLQTQYLSWNTHQQLLIWFQLITFPKWLKVAKLHMTDNQCPSDLELLTSPHGTCGMKNFSSPTSSSDTFTVGGIGYSKVCGGIRAYQIATPDAFSRYPNTG